MVERPFAKWQRSQEAGVGRLTTQQSKTVNFSKHSLRQQHTRSTAMKQVKRALFTGKDSPDSNILSPSEESKAFYQELTGNNNEEQVNKQPITARKTDTSKSMESYPDLHLSPNEICGRKSSNGARMETLNESETNSPMSISSMESESSNYESDDLEFCLGLCRMSGGSVQRALERAGVCGSCIQTIMERLSTSGGTTTTTKKL